MSRRRNKSASSPPPKPTTSDQQQEQWERHFATLAPEDQECIERETREAKAVSGSRLGAAKHLSKVHDVLCRDLKNPKQKRQWTLYLRVTLPGVAVSRSQMFRDIQAWRVAQDTFRPEFLNEFLSSGYAFNVRPTVEQPLGKMTEPCQQILAKLKPEELNGVQFRTVLAEAANIVKENAKKNRAPRTPLSADEKRSQILKGIHETVLSGLEDLARAIEPGQKYPTSNVRDELEEIVGRLLTATGIETLELERRVLEDGYRSLSLPVPAPKPRKKTTNAGGARVRVARESKRESLHTHKTVEFKDSVPVSTVLAVEVPSVA